MLVIIILLYFMFCCSFFDFLFFMKSQFLVGFVAYGTNIMYNMEEFNSYLFFYMMFIFTVVMSYMIPMIFSSVNGCEENRIFSIAEKDSTKLTVSILVESFWTIVPLYLMLLISFPSFSMLFDEYSLNGFEKTFFSVHVIGHQWYWSYDYDFDTLYRFPVSIEMEMVEYGLSPFYSTLFDFLRLFLSFLGFSFMSLLVVEAPDYLHPLQHFGMSLGYGILGDFIWELYSPAFKLPDNEYSIFWSILISVVVMTGEASFDSHLLVDLDDFFYEESLLSTDHSLILPSSFPCFMIITSSDVLHSWAVPAFGMKVDAVPGRLNMVSFSILSEGYFFGQCSELCGVNHGFMPMSVYVVSFDDFFYWGYS